MRTLTTQETQATHGAFLFPAAYTFHQCITATAATIVVAEKLIGYAAAVYAKLPEYNRVQTCLTSA